MCYWGEAYALGPNINAPMDPAAAGPAATVVEKARERAGRASEHERALIAALTQRYAAEAQTDRATLNQAYTNAMAQVAARFPEDVDILSLYADALMNLAPWDYWEADGSTLKPPVQDLVPTLERALTKDPDHPYAIHLYIHAVEASTTPKRAERYADDLAATIPGAGHIVHMPGHIYFRTGRFRDSIATNLAAVSADEYYLSVADPEGWYRYSYYPHNVHFLLESARMAGDGETALQAAEKLPRILSDAVAHALPWVEIIKAAPYFAHAQFSAPEVVLGLADPGAVFPYVKAMWHYARGVAHAVRDDAQAAQAEADAIAAIGESTDWTDMVKGGVPAPDLLRLARHVISARIAQAQGDNERATEDFRAAVAIQDTLPYLEPPYWYYPVRQSLGAALLQAGKASEAEQAFRAALDEFPNNAWALYGLMAAQRAQGNDAGAAETQHRFQEVWEGAEGSLDLAHL
jgi:tetratricopeptide (TPR) repeat protein